MKKIIEGPRGPISFSVQGRGPALVLIAGLGSRARLWGELPSLLGRHFTVICPENRGVAESRGGDAFSLSSAAEDIVFCLDELGLARASLLGVSMGGIIAQRLAIDFPGRIDRLIIASAAARLSVHGRRTMEMLRDLLDFLPPRDFGRALMCLAFAPPFQNRFPAFVSQAAELYGLEDEDVPGTRGQAEHLLEGWDYRDALGKLRVPTLIISGVRDAVVSIEDSREIASLIEGSEFLSLPDAGHSVLAEGGSVVLERILDFLGT